MLLCFIAAFILFYFIAHETINLASPMNTAKYDKGCRGMKHNTMTMCELVFVINYYAKRYNIAVFCSPKIKQFTTNT